MLRKILASTTALLCSQLTEAASTENSKTDYSPLLCGLVPLALIGLWKFAEETNKALPIWQYLYFLNLTDSALEKEFFNKDKPTTGAYNIRTYLGLLRDYENQCPETQTFQEKMHGFSNWFKTPASIKENLEHKPVAETKKNKRKRPGKNERLRARGLFDSGKPNSEVKETKRNTNS